MIRYLRETEKGRLAFIGVFASAALLLGGCTSDQPSQTAWRTTGDESPRVAQASARENPPPEQRSNQAEAAPQRFEFSRAFPTGNRKTSDLMVEQIGPREPRVGKPCTYQIRVTNLTDQPLTGIVLRQKISENFKVSQTNGVQEDNREAKIDIGDLGPHQSKTIQVSGTPSQPGTLDTCLSAQYNPPTLCAQIAIVAPAIKATAQGPTEADICQDLVYRYTVTNTGTGTAHNVVLEEQLPDGLQSAQGQRTLSVNAGDLAQGQSKTIAAHVKATRAGRYTSRAIVKSDDGQVQADQVATEIRATRLAVTITSPKEEVAGQQQMTYRIDVKNIGDAPANHTRLRVGATPGQVAFVNAEGGEGAQLASEREGGGQDLGSIDPGQSRTVTINFRPLKGGQTAFAATAQADCAQPVTTSSNVEMRGITASALVVTHDPDPVNIGSDVTYHITVQNKGNMVDRNIKLTAALPESEQFVRGGGQSQVRNDGQNITFGVVPELQPKQTISWDVIAKALRPDQAKFQATMTSDSTPTPAVKIEPTKLFGGNTGTQTHTNQAPPTGANPQNH